jgi:hypothetical protein
MWNVVQAQLELGGHHARRLRQHSRIVQPHAYVYTVAKARLMGLCFFAGQLAVWEGVVPAGLPGPAADVDALAGVRKPGAAPAGKGAAAGVHGGGGAAADGASVLEGGLDGGAAMGAPGSDDYDRDDSFLAESGAAV